MTPEEIKRILEKQLQLLSEESTHGTEPVADITMAMLAVLHELNRYL